MDKADKEFYGNRQMREELLAKHVFGKVLPSEIVARLEIESMKTRPTELRDSTQKVVRHVDLLWRVRFRGSWLYLILLFEAQSSVDWRMPLRILHETALVYQELSKDPEVRKWRTRRCACATPGVVKSFGKRWRSCGSCCPSAARCGRRWWRGRGAG